MADTIHTRTLTRAAEVQGSTQALASLLRVPENTLLRWMSGRAQMPLQGFLRLIELLVQHEKTGMNGAVPVAAEKLSFQIGAVAARCARCGGSDFRPALPGTPFGFTSRLVCCSCSEEVVHGDLVARLARDAVQQSRASPKLRAPKRAP